MAKIAGAVEVREDRGSQWRCILEFSEIADAEVARFLFLGASGAGTRPPYKLRGLPRDVNSLLARRLVGAPPRASWLSLEELEKFQKFFAGATGRGSYHLKQAQDMAECDIRHGYAEQGRFVFWEIETSEKKEDACRERSS